MHLRCTRLRWRISIYKKLLPDSSSPILKVRGGITEGTQKLLLSTQISTRPLYLDVYSSIYLLAVQLLQLSILFNSSYFPHAHTLLLLPSGIKTPPAHSHLNSSNSLYLVKFQFTQKLRLLLLDLLDRLDESLRVVVVVQLSEFRVLGLVLLDQFDLLLAEGGEDIYWRGRINDTIESEKGISGSSLS